LHLAGDARVRQALAAAPPGPLHEDDLPLLEYRLPRAQFAGASADWVVVIDGRRPESPDPDNAFLRWAERHPLDAAAKEAFTVVQSGQLISPPKFRKRYLDEVLGSETDLGVFALLRMQFQATGDAAAAEAASAAATRAIQKLQDAPAPKAAPGD